MKAALIVASAASLLGAVTILFRPRLEARPGPRPQPALPPAPSELRSRPPSDDARDVDSPLLGSAADGGPAEAGRRIKEHVRGSAGRPVGDLARAEEELLRLLRGLSAPQAVELLLEAESPVGIHLVLRAVDEGLRVDRLPWEEALGAGLERLAGDAGRLEAFAELLEPRFRTPEGRGHAARLLRKRASDDRLTALAGRLAAGSGAEAEVREWLWSRVPGPGAVEALGHLVPPDEAVRLEALGPGRHVLRSLSTAYERTKDPAFKVSMLRLHR